MRTVLNVICLVGMLMVVACVPLKQFEEVKSRNSKLTSDLKRLERKNDDLEARNTELKSMVQRLSRLVEDLKADTTQLSRDHQKVELKNKELVKKYSDLLDQYNRRAGDDKEARELLAYLQTLQEELQRREDALREKERELLHKQRSLEQTLADLGQTQSDLALNQSELEARNARLEELERILSRKDSAMAALRNSVANALTGFSSDELEVHVKNGKVYVSLEEKLLFKSGSYDVSPLGVGALKKLAEVLESKTDINILVEGHTDDVAYTSGRLLDNWDLSVKRATSVVRILLTGTSIDPVRVTASGRGEFLPLEQEATVEARRRNRRTEIILTPPLDKLLDILENN